MLFMALFTQATDKQIFSEKLRSALSSTADEPLLVWLYFDSTQIADNPINLSERALTRRAKVDPVNFLITETDYPLRSTLIDSIRSSGVIIKHISRWFKAVVVEVPVAEVSVLESFPGLKRLDLVQTMIGVRDPELEPNSFEKLVVNDSTFYGLSYTQNQNARTIKLHNAGYSGKGVLIAMFDSGFNPDHQAFDSTSLLATWDFINDREAVDGADCLTQTQDQHGTATWSTVGGYVPDTIVGSAYGADFALAKTEITCNNIEIKAEEYNWIAAAEWADSLGADIITASLGYFDFQDSGSYTQEQLDGNTALITIAADMAASKNILMVNSAGNERRNQWGTILFPADGDSVLAVGAINPDSTLTSFSSPGPTADGRVKPDIVTQGSAVYVALSQNNDWTRMNGTSFSAPILAGCAALIMESGPSLTAEEVRQMIIQSGDRFDNPDYDFGYGIFDAVRAADIIKWDPIPPIILTKGMQTIVQISVSGRFSAETQMQGLDLPDGIILEDLIGGNGRLILDESVLADTEFTIKLVATINSFEDTTSINITTYNGPNAQVTVGPNPFSDSVRIFVYHTPAQMTITVFNLAGEKIREIINNSPEYAETIVWDGRNSAGHQIASGVYIILVQTDVITQQLKVLKIK